MIKVLSIDGGGIRGLIPTMLLDYIEKQTGRYTSDLFDLVAGTSSGGVVALGLVYPGTPAQPRYSAEQLSKFFLDEGATIFQTQLGVLRQIVDEKHPHEPIEQVLKKYFGDVRLSEAHKPVVVPAYDVQSASPRFFKSRHADTDGKIPMWQVARATTAAPTFFESFRLDTDERTEALIDGGMIANNPAMSAFTEVTHHLDDYVVSERFDEQVMVVSIGTGRLRQYYTHDQIKDWGALEWARPAIEIAITGAVETVHYQMQEILRANDERYYYRFQTDVPDKNRAMDDASPENLAVIMGLAQQMLEDYRADLDEMIEKLL
jgi:patatin-like phospholipase/acyl hydrolase